MSSKDIEKLKERVNKDPNSKLFVPLADEYRKEGLVEEAIMVLQEGLERQPGYMSARVALGKIYLEKGMTQEAQGEFENVIKAIPDNLYAHKKLAEIYRDTGKRDLAIKAYRAVLKLNSMDEDAISNLHELEDSMPQEEVGDQGVTAEIAEEVSSGFEEGVEEEFAVAAYETSAEAPGEEELDAFKDSLFGGKDEEEAEEVSLVEEEAEGLAEEGTAFGPGEDAVQEDSHELPESHGDRTEDIEVMPEEGAGETGKEEIPATQQPSESLDVSAVTPGPRDQIGGNSDKLLADAEEMISREDYAGAMSIYKKILSGNPGDRKVMQRVEELRFLLKMTGKDKDALISRLSDFLEGVKKGRDGFSGST